MLLLRDGAVQEVLENGLMLAAFDFATYSTAAHRLEPGDRLLLYTDGILEASTANGEFFGQEALSALMRETAESAAIGCSPTGSFPPCNSGPMCRKTISPYWCATISAMGTAKRINHASPRRLLFDNPLTTAK